MESRRFCIERKALFQREAESICAQIKKVRVPSLERVRILSVYDIAWKSDYDAHTAEIQAVLSEPQTDDVFMGTPEDIALADHILMVRALPGQYDQRADSAQQCLELILQERPHLYASKLYLFYGTLTEKDKVHLEEYVVNPVDSMSISWDAPIQFIDPEPTFEDIPVLHALIEEASLEDFKSTYGLAMDIEDLSYLRSYFKDVLKRPPTETELRVIDTYWSDHCRHTTFNTVLEDIAIEDANVLASYQLYQALRKEVYGEKAATRPATLMDMATIATKTLKKRGLLPNLDESEEINACSVKTAIPCNDGEVVDWLHMFKNETHNHPTEVEPFGGAATCLGGAIRDPLSGRSYVYQSMRITGAKDPNTPYSETRKGKLPQQRICQLARDGFSSYGNQIGLATGLVDEVYHPGYEAKRMEVGAVVAGAPASQVIRKRPEPGDVVLLIGGRTGRDGCGGATGSSKAHTESSLQTSGAEVQKGNPVEERKIQRFFRNSNIAKRIKRCNDFGAGGVSVAVGELAGGIDINLNAIPKKYLGLNGTELAISESQERMAVVVAASDVDLFIEEAQKENLEATPIAKVTEEQSMKMHWNHQTIVDLPRDFLDSAGVTKKATVKVTNHSSMKRDRQWATSQSFSVRMKELLSNLNVASKRGLVETFDATIGSGTVLMPFGGETQRTPIQTMVAKLPLLHKEHHRCSLFSWGFNPYVSEHNPHRGAYEAVVESLCKLLATGSRLEEAYLSLQEYFPTLKNDPEKWGLPMAALLGALQAQYDFRVPAIGGKDSMSGTFEELEVPPTLISFATTLDETDHILSPEFKSAGNAVYLFTFPKNEHRYIAAETISECLDVWRRLLKDNRIRSAWSVSHYGIAEGLAKMSFGNQIGVAIDDAITDEELFMPAIGSMLIEVEGNCSEPYCTYIGTTTQEPSICYKNDHVAIDAMLKWWEHPLEATYPTQCPTNVPVALKHSECSTSNLHYKASRTYARPHAVIPVFPGTNCEYDTQAILEKAGASTEFVIVRNLTPSMLKDSVERLVQAIKKSQMLIFPGGFSFGDEPDGSAKFIATFMRQPALEEAVMRLLQEQDGLIMGICNGFQALVKLGLLPYGKMMAPSEKAPTLTHNAIGRHQSRYVYTKVVSNQSPWLSLTPVGSVYRVPISHGEGRFIAPEKTLHELYEKGQIFSQYVDGDGRASMNIEYNPNGSLFSVEGLLSPDGRILGKMAHIERVDKDTAKNIPGEKLQPIFESGVHYFK